MRAPTRLLLAAALGVVAAFALTGCFGEAGQAADWTGQIDTLSGGHVKVWNPAIGLWSGPQRWTLSEELRIGRVEGEGPDVFGRVTGFEVDDLERVWVVDGQARELRAFAQSGNHLVTVGSEGSGPGEFLRPVHVAQSPGGELWVMDPDNASLSVFDTTGEFDRSIPATGGFVTLPWPGGFSDDGLYYAPFVRFEPSFEMVVGTFDASLTAVDTIALPQDREDRPQFRIVRGGLPRVVASVPFQGRLLSRLSPQRTVWALITDEYRLFELTADGDTLRSVTRDFDAVPVTSRERSQAIEELAWFTEQGGTIDPSLIPDSRPPVDWFFLDDVDHLWVAQAVSGERVGQDVDVFDPEGRYLGAVTAPFSAMAAPQPIVRGDNFYAVVRDEFDVQYLVRARISR